MTSQTHGTCQQRCATSLLLALALTAFASTGGQASPTTSEMQLKASFIVKLLRFASWHGDQPTAPCICIVGNPGLAAELENIEIAPQSSHTHFSAREVPLPGRLDNCDVVFLGGLNRGEQRRYLALLEGKPMMTIGESASFVSDGGMIGLEINNSRLGFKVNLRATRAAGISLGVQVLRLAESVLTHEMEASAQ